MIVGPSPLRNRTRRPHIRRGMAHRRIASRPFRRTRFSGRVIEHCWHLSACRIGTSRFHVRAQRRCSSKTMFSCQNQSNDKFRQRNDYVRKSRARNVKFVAQRRAVSAMRSLPRGHRDAGHVLGVSLQACPATRTDCRDAWCDDPTRIADRPFTACDEEGGKEALSGTRPELRPMRCASCG